MNLTLALTGDSILQRRLMSTTDPAATPLFDLIRGADIAFTNLEVVPNDYRGDPALESGGSHFGAPAWVLDDLAEAGFNLFATAHNHALDYSIAGLRHALAAMNARGLTHAGTGENLEEARRPAYHPHPNGTAALLSCSATFAKGQEASAQRPDMPGRPGLNPLRYDTVYEVTAPQLATLRQVADQLGLEKDRQTYIQLGFVFPPEDPKIFPVKDMNFREAETPRRGDHAAPEGHRRHPPLGARGPRPLRHRRGQRARARAGHRQGTPAAFLPIFAHAMIDAGADMVVGHGPHLLRGMELYKGRPIFYSLGNFIGQNELVPRLPADSYDRFRADPDATPGQVYRKRTDNDRRGFPSDPRYWESVVAVCNHADGKLAGVTIHPVTLGLGQAAHARGRPRLATGEEGAKILARFAALSKPFGTEMTIAEGVARVG